MAVTVLRKEGARNILILTMLSVMAMARRRRRRVSRHYHRDGNYDDYQYYDYENYDDDYYYLLLPLLSLLSLQLLRRGGNYDLCYDYGYCDYHHHEDEVDDDGDNDVPVC